MSESKQREEKKKEEFEANPNDFIHRSDVLVGIVREREGVYPVFNKKINRMTLVNALYDLSHQGDMYIMQMDMAVAEKNKSNIVTPGGDNGGVNRIAT